MRTIIPAMESIAQLWGHPQPKDVKYRLMKYLLRADVEDGILLQNTVTEQMVLLSDEEAKAVNELPANPSESMKELIENHFLVPEDFNEYSSVKQLRTIYQKRAQGDSINHYIILPTTYCNARCFYCYESNYPRVHMTEETADKLIDYIAEHRKGKDVKLSWFGGEPLLGAERINQICQGLKDRGIPFYSSMISNGYLFDEELVEKSVKLWNLKRVQITLDGTEEVYNRVKAYVINDENPFRRVLRNIDLLAGNKIQVNIRLNMDFYNKDDIQNLIEDLGKKYSGRRVINVYLNMLFNDEGFEPVHHSLEEIIEIMKIIDGFTQRLVQLGLTNDYEPFPHLKTNQCMADSPHAVEIQPDGSFCRCEHENILDSYGNLDEGILDPQKPLKWKEIIERSENCPDCPVYPACYLLRQCMNADAPCLEYYRQRRQGMYKNMMCEKYYKSLEDEKNEGVQGS